LTSWFSVPYCTPKEIPEREHVAYADWVFDAVGEFALCGKPELTYRRSPELAHLEMLSRSLLYNNPAQLKDWIQRIASGERFVEDGGAYRNCTPEKVMEVFNRHFIE
jgi:hypothetical protein